jgi:hypothetical protein
VVRADPELHGEHAEHQRAHDGDVHVALASSGPSGELAPAGRLIIGRTAVGRQPRSSVGLERDLVGPGGV